AALDILENPSGLAAYAESLFGAGPSFLLLLPTRLLVRPALATDVVGFLVAVPAALIVLGLNVVWVLRTAVDLEEGALESARRLDEARSRVRRGAVRRPTRFRRTRPPFRLSPTGPPEIALLWKNLICMTRDIGGIRPLAFIVAGSLIPTFIILSATGGTAVALPVLGMMCAMVSFALLAMGPGLFRTEFRNEVLHIERLKPYPLEGREIVVGTIAAPVVVLTAVQWLLLMGFGALAASQPAFNLQWLEHPGMLAVTAAVLVLPVNMVSALVHTAALLVVPGWTALGTEQTTGMERFGQSIIATLGRMLALTLGLLPAVIAFTVAWFFISAFVSAQSALPLAAIPAALVASMEGWVGIQLLGSYVERFDPSRELDSLAR
ncbi:MAG TPA: hypothetical protein VFG76_09520, partial [Candidatus Polarisedimenticolia bacterium]|nr:hypothetical protein [Candidatus Polarisedimenticolia bacterium]